MNKLSFSRLDDYGTPTVISKNSCTFVNREHSYKILASILCRSLDELYTVKTFEKEAKTKLFAMCRRKTAENPESDMNLLFSHRRMGLSYCSVLQKMVDARKYELDCCTFFDVPACNTCVHTKPTERPSSGESVHRSKANTNHTDVRGPFTHRSFGGGRYFVPRVHSDNGQEYLSFVETLRGKDIEHTTATPYCPHFIGVTK